MLCLSFPSSNESFYLFGPYCGSLLTDGSKAMSSKDMHIYM